MKAEIDKLDINELINVPTSFTNLKITEDDLDVDKLKFVPVYLKSVRDVVGKEVAKSTKFN